jgi:hypothetical protein
MPSQRVDLLWQQRGLYSPIDNNFYGHYPGAVKNPVESLAAYFERVSGLLDCHAAYYIGGRDKCQLLMLALRG